MRTALAAILASATIAAGPLPLRPGTYTRVGETCSDAPFADLLDYDGRGIGDAHSSKCRSRVLSRHGNIYRVSTTCRAEGDGTPTSPFTFKQVIRIVSAITFEDLDTSTSTAVRFHRCSGFPDEADH